MTSNSQEASDSPHWQLEVDIWRKFIETGMWPLKVLVTDPSAELLGGIRHAVKSVQINTFVFQ